MTTPSTPAPHSSISFVALKRGQLVAVSVIGLILGLVGIFFPSNLLIFSAIVFGVYLVFSGIFRINAALITHGLSAGARWLSALLGVLIVVAGVICLSDPFGTLIVLAYVIGIGWIAEGLSDIMGAIQGATRPRWFAAISGIVSALAGIVIFILPTLGILTFVFVGSILLIVVSVSTLLTMPRKPKEPVA